MFVSARNSLDYTLWEYPIWFIKRKRFEFAILWVGSFISLIWVFFAPNSLVYPQKTIIWLALETIPACSILMSKYRFDLLHDLENDPLRCDCGGHFVDPDELGFVSDGYHLICDNDDVGDGWACEKSIVNPSIVSAGLRRETQ